MEPRIAPAVFLVNSPDGPGNEGTLRWAIAQREANVAGSGGGGIFNMSGDSANIVLTKSTVSGNSAPLGPNIVTVM